MPTPRGPLKVIQPEPVVHTRDGGEIRRSPRGEVREVRTPAGAVIRYAPDGMRRVEVERPGGRVVFANGDGHAGYVQHPYRVHDQTFVQRTYVERGTTYTRVYRPWVRQGVTYNVYMPSRYYRPAYYSWTSRRWDQPVYYRWGWGERPWYGYYRGYYTPYPYYASPIFWLTDFMVAVTLETAYQARVDSGAAAPAPYYDTGGMTPEVKQAIAEEVRRQVEQERAEQRSMGQGYDAPPPLFSDNVSRIFLVDTPTVAYLDGEERHLSEGTVLQLNGAPPPNSAYADVAVLASRDRYVPRGSVVSVSLVDLQEMQNHMRANIDRGLGDLQARQGQDGLPALPPRSLGTSDADYASGVQPDLDAARELSRTVDEADQSSREVLSQSPAPDPVVTLGMTEAEVRAVLGRPSQVADAGSRRIEVYPNFKVVYTNGRVTDIQ